MSLILASCNTLVFFSSLGMGKDRVQHGSDQEKDQAHEVTPQHKANNNVSFLLYSVLFICVPILFIVDISFYSQLITEARLPFF